MLELMPHQIEGACFLAEQSAALLADKPRVGKTPASIAACDMVFARSILVITKASYIAQWGRELGVWGFPRKVQVLFTGDDKLRADTEAVVVGWPLVYRAAIHRQLMARRWDVLIPDECHEAKNYVTQRSTAVWGTSDDSGRTWSTDAALVSRAAYVWPLSGTPTPNAPNDLWVWLRSQAPERLKAGVGSPDAPDVTVYDDFVARYCIVKLKRLGGVVRPVVKGGKRIEELRARTQGLWLQRTQADVGIKEPIFSVFALSVPKLPPELDELAEAQAVFDAMETGETKSLEMHLGPLRQMTGAIKAAAVINAAVELLEDRQIDKLVLMAWHTSVIDLLWAGLARFGVVGIDGRTPITRRAAIEASFRDDPTKRVFVGQMVAAGEAIDLSAAADLWFVESSFVPKDMAQAALRITNHSQKRQPLVRVCALAGSIDEAIQTILTRKVSSIRQLMEPNPQ